MARGHDDCGIGARRSCGGEASQTIRDQLLRGFEGGTCPGIDGARPEIRQEYEADVDQMRMVIEFHRGHEPDLVFGAAHTFAAPALARQVGAIGHIASANRRVSSRAPVALKRLDSTRQAVRLETPR